MKRVNKEKVSSKKIPRQQCASLRSFLSPSFLGCFAGVITYVDSLFEYRHRYSMCHSKDLRSAEPPSTPPPRVVSLLYIYLGTRRGVQNCRRMPLALDANNFKTVLFFIFFIFQVFSFGLRMNEVVEQLQKISIASLFGSKNQVTELGQKRWMFDN